MTGPRFGLQAMAGADDVRARDRRAVLRRLVRELAPEWPMLLLALCFIVVGAAAQAAGPWLVGRAIDVDIRGADRSGLSRTMLLLLAAYVTGALATRGQIRRVGVAGQRALARLRGRLFSRLQRLPLAYFARHPVGDLLSRVLNDVDTLNQLLSGGLTQLVGAVFSIGGIVAAMLLLDVRLALASLAIIPLMLGTTAYFARRARRAFRTTRETVGDVTAGLEREITGIREAQAFGRTQLSVARFREQNAANRAANVEAVAITSAFAPAIDLLSTAATAVVIGYGSWLVFNGGLTVGVVAAFLLYVQQFFRPIQLASVVYTQAQSALAGGERIYSVLDEEPEPVEPPDRPALPPVEGRVEFDHVTFGYDPARPVLHDVSFTALPGQTVALVGATGAGKTTIANLVARFYDVTSGSIRVDGHDVREVTRASLRRQIAMVLQDAYLFSGTVRENIAFGRLEATDDEVEAAARSVRAHDFITDLPQGYATPIGEGGASLSQGQRQLIAFARAVLAGPRILILDEATSSIDTRTEALIQDALAGLLRGRTSLVIAHRLSTIRDADQILVVDGGRIVERGRHDELMALGGVYATMRSRG